MFQIRQRGSTPGREVLGGVTTFMAMSYILFVQPAVLSKAGMDGQAVFMATCISSAAACILMGLLSNYPIALAPGMGENFFFVFTLCGVGAAAGAFSLSWPEALALTFLVGVVFLLLSVVGFRSMVLNAIPDALKSGIAAGIGLFIALIGFEWGNVVVHDPFTCVKLAGMTGNFVAALTLAGLAVTLALAAFHVRGAILLGILVTTACTWGVARLPMRPDLGVTLEAGKADVAVVKDIVPCSPAGQAGLIRKGDVIAAIDGREVRTLEDLNEAWAATSDARTVKLVLIRGFELMTVEHPARIETITLKTPAEAPPGTQPGGSRPAGQKKGLALTAGKFVGGFEDLWKKVVGGNWLHLLTFAFILLFMDLFDTVGTLVGVAKRAGLMTDGKLPRAERALAADAAGTVIGAAMGTSTVTSYIESITGVQSGARTGLAAIVTGVCLLAAMLVKPLVLMVSRGVATGAGAKYPMIAPALIMVGAMMMRAMRDVKWEDLTEALPAFLAMVTMPFTYSISTGIAIGFVAYAFGKLVTGRVTECPIIVYVFAVLFVTQYVFLMP